MRNLKIMKTSKMKEVMEKKDLKKVLKKVLKMMTPVILDTCPEKTSTKRLKKALLSVISLVSTNSAI